MRERIGGLLLDLANLIAGSPVSGLATQALRSIPGLPPILQTVHLLSVAVLMGTVVLLQLRVLGLAVRSQPLPRLRQRLMPWAWAALAVLPLSMAPLLMARPHRYLLNPVFGIKMLLLLAALSLTLVVIRAVGENGPAALAWHTRIAASLALCAWLLTVLGGRWIAYSDYLFWPA